MIRIWILLFSSWWPSNGFGLVQYALLDRSPRPICGFGRILINQHDVRGCKKMGSATDTITYVFYETKHIRSFVVVRIIPSRQLLIKQLVQKVISRRRKASNACQVHANNPRSTPRKKKPCADNLAPRTQSTHRADKTQRGWLYARVRVMIFSTQVHDGCEFFCLLECSLHFFSLPPFSLSITKQHDAARRAAAKTGAASLVGSVNNGNFHFKLILSTRTSAYREQKNVHNSRPKLLFPVQ